MVVYGIFYSIYGSLDILELLVRCRDHMVDMEDMLHMAPPNSRLHRNNNLLMVAMGKDIHHRCVTEHFCYRCQSGTPPFLFVRWGRHTWKQRGVLLGFSMGTGWCVCYSVSGLYA